jgi:hypothetical protein
LDNAWPSLHSRVPKNAIPEPAGIVPMYSDPDFFTALRMNEQPVTALAGTLLDERFI